MGESAAGIGDEACAGDHAEVEGVGFAVHQGTQKPGIAEEGGEVMVVIEAEAAIIGTLPKTPTVESYLYALGRACIEAAANPRVRSLLFSLLWRAPGTLAELAGRTKRIAA